ncbi:histidinol-phosphate aminotransferase [Thiogranum longum]|uniref:Histidinol-phosphate aminotransferase n=1 Tax=Thiogranum longum TaxID=1537524 RepID=A0A4R1H8C2_9GAMM|nr:histidinol-phosphate transaminase [Thiogranum longum]TCK18087.1 histidinol-phosphate aminotransferase [Thiogranum longum]
MTASLLESAIPGVQGLRPYAPGKPLSELEREYGITDAVKLASNENPLGPSKSVLDALQCGYHELARYPDGNGFELKSALAERHDVKAEWITLGNGSNDVLEMVARAFLSPQSSAVFSAHAFAVYPIVTQAIGARSRVAAAHNGRRGPLFGHDLDAMHAQIDADTRVVFIANPNNPTGTWLPHNALRSFIESVPAEVVVVIDEAYFEYVDEEDYPDTSQWVDEFPNLLVTRTFSKAYGLASLRIGYGVSQPILADVLNRVRQPFNVNSFAQLAARAALDDREHLARAVEINRQGMAQLTKGFDELTLPYIPSAGNFISVDVGRDPGTVYEALLHEGVIVRPVDNYGMPGYLRVSIGLEDENRRCLEALGKVLA